MESPTGMIENGRQVSAAARQIGVCRAVARVDSGQLTMDSYGVPSGQFQI